MEYKLAKELSDKFLNILGTVCSRIEVVGSVKRADKPEVHDIEFLMILKNIRPVPEFGKPNQIYLTMLDKLLADLEYEGVIGQAMNKKDGDKYKKRAIKNVGLNEFCLDMFIVNESSWGIQNVIRTGPSLFSHRCVTNRNRMMYDRETGNKYSGFLPNQYRYIRASEARDEIPCVITDKGILSLPEEADFINLIFGQWVDNKERRKLAEMLRPNFRN